MGGYFFIFPWILGLVMFTGGPIIASFILSLCDYDIVNPPNFVGLANYKRMFTEDPLFYQSLKVTSIYTFVAVPLGLVFSLMVAILMNRKIKGISLFRTIYYAPAVVTGVSLSLLWVWIFNPEFGVFNLILSKFGIQGLGWLASTKWALPALIIMSFWGVGGPMLIYLAGLQGIPTALYEAAEIDGASSWFKFWKITIPMITPVIFFNLVMGIIGSFQVFTQGYVMTGGGPHYATLFYVLHLYNNAFQWFKMGYASALAWVLFIIIFACTLFIFKFSATWVYYEGTTRR